MVSCVIYRHKKATERGGEASMKRSRIPLLTHKKEDARRVHHMQHMGVLICRPTPRACDKQPRTGRQPRGRPRRSFEIFLATAMHPMGLAAKVGVRSARDVLLREALTPAGGQIVTRAAI